MAPFWMRMGADRVDRSDRQIVGLLIFLPTCLFTCLSAYLLICLLDPSGIQPNQGDG
jgi:hypothetical protein